MLFGVDAHCTYQAGLNVESLAKEGFSFLVVKATQGAGGYTAPAMFNDWIRRARAAGMVVGAYHWLDSSDPVRQADRFVERLAPIGGPDGLLLQIDCEDTTSPATAAQLAAFVAQLRHRAGSNRPLLFYTGSWWYGAHLGGYNAAALGLHSWHSHYVGGSGKAATLASSVTAAMWAPGYGGFARAAILQYTSKGTAGGIAGNVDLNVFQGTRDDLAALTSADGNQNMSIIIAGEPIEQYLPRIERALWWPIPDAAKNIAQVAATVQALNAAAEAAKARDTANAVTIAALQGAVTKLTDTMAALSLGGTGVELDGTTIADAITATVKAEAAAVRDLVEKRHADQLAQMQHDRDAEVSALLAEVNALKADQPAGA